MKHLFTLLLLAFLPIAHAQEELRTNPKFVQNFREVVQPHTPSVVRIRCDGKDTCLGIVVGSDGWILTKAHDLRGKINCALHDGRDYEGRIVGVHEGHDLALLKIAAPSLRALPWSHSKHLKAGNWVASVGLGQDAAAVGIVSVPTRKVYEAFLGVLADSSPQGLVVL